MPHPCVSTPTEPRAQHNLIGTRGVAAAGIHADAGEAAVAVTTGLGEVFPWEIGASIKMGMGPVRFRSSLGGMNGEAHGDLNFEHIQDARWSIRYVWRNMDTAQIPHTP